MTQTLPPFVARYARLEAEGLAGDREELAFLNAHEVALHAFTTRAAAGGGRESLAPVWALLEPASAGCDHTVIPSEARDLSQTPCAPPPKDPSLRSG